VAAAVIFGLALAGSIIVQTQALTPEEIQMAAAGTPVLHFLYLAPIILTMSLVALVLVSLGTHKPDEKVVRTLTWSPTMFVEETPALAGLPWYKNYRYQSVGMLVLIAMFVIAW
jgi:solute:Na+ symporter, SSS family